MSDSQHHSDRSNDPGNPNAKHSSAARQWCARCTPSRRCAATTCIVICSSLVHILGIAATCFAPARPIVYILPPLLVVSLALTVYLFWFAPSAAHAGRRHKHAPLSTANTTSPSSSAAPPRGARVFGLDPATVSPPASAAHSPTSATRRRRTSGTSDHASALISSSTPIAERGGGGLMGDSMGSLVDALDNLQVTTTTTAPTTATVTASSSRHLLSDPSLAAVPPMHQPIPATSRPPQQHWTRSWRHWLCLVLNPLIMLTWLFLVIYIVFFPYWFRDVDAVHFVRLGHVTDSSCHVAFRVPTAAVKVAVQFRPLPADTSASPAPWTTTSPPVDVAAHPDRLGDVRLTGLQPNTLYEYYLVDGERGTRLSHASTSVDEPILGGTFKTNYAVVDAVKARATLAFGSCIKRDTPFFTERGIRGFRDMNTRAELRGIDQMLFFGDWVYVDVPFFYKDSPEAFRWHYKNVMDVSEAREVARRIPMYFTYDDHEISNNWAKGESPPYPNAKSAFFDYLAVTNPAPTIPDGVYFNYTTPPACFFFMDTRRYRTQPNTPTSSMLGPAQLAHVKQWLTDPHPGCNWRFLVSSVPMTINWSIDDDTWYGYREERRDLLHFIRDQGVRNIVVLSGDRHDVAVQRMDANPDVVEASVSPVTNFHSPISVYRKGNGDEVLFKPKIGPVAVGVVEVEWAQVKFKVWDGEKIAWEYLLQAKE